MILTRRTPVAIKLKTKTGLTTTVADLKIMGTPMADSDSLSTKTTGVRVVTSHNLAVRITVPIEHLESVVPPVGEHEQMTRQGILFELLDDQTVQPVETATQLHRRGGHQHPHDARYAQHGSARNSWGNVCNSELFCNRTIHPCGLTTSIGQRGVGLGNRTS